MTQRWLARLALGTLLLALAAGPVHGTPPNRPPGSPWLMFHYDERHTGLTPGSGSIPPGGPPSVHWTYRITAAPTITDFLTYRWYSSFPLGDLDGDGTLEVVVTSPDNVSGDPPARIIALEDLSGRAARALWTYNSPSGAEGRFDQYSAALADADSDGLLDVLFASKDGYLRALKGTTGQLIWEYFTGRFIEAGPMIADLESDGPQEAIVVTDCALGPGCPGTVSAGQLLVFAADPPGSPTSNPPLWSRDYPYKLDSAEPAIADFDPNDGRGLKQIVIGSWGARLHVVWRVPPGGPIVDHSLDIRTLDPSVPPDANSVVRSSPLVADFGEGLTAVFGWMPDWTIGTEARISAVGIHADTVAGTVQFQPRSTPAIDRDDWKSSVALVPRTPISESLAVTGYGIGTNQGTGRYGDCNPVTGGIIALRRDGSIAWEHTLGPSEGNVRASPAVADIDGDGRLEVVLSFGCYGKIHAWDALTGTPEWDFQLGPRTIGTPSIGDLDGDGHPEIVVGSYDGQVWVLGGPVYGSLLPAIVR